MNKVYIATVVILLFKVFEELFAIGGVAVELAFIKYGSPFLLYGLLLSVTFISFILIISILYRALFKWKESFISLILIFLGFLFLKFLKYLISNYSGNVSDLDHGKYLESFNAQTIVWEYFNYSVLIVLIGVFFFARKRLGNKEQNL